MSKRIPSMFGIKENTKLGQLVMLEIRYDLGLFDLNNDPYCQNENVNRKYEQTKQFVENYVRSLSHGI